MPKWHSKNRKGNPKMNKTHMWMILAVVIGVMVADLVKPLVSSILTPNA